MTAPEPEGLTTEERMDVRQGLIDMEFRRGAPLNWAASTHLDKGDGAYAEEWWGPGRTHVVLTWQPKALAAFEADRATAGERECDGSKTCPKHHHATPPADDASERGCRWSDARGRWEWEIRPGVSKEACDHLAHTRGDDLYMPDERPTVVTSATPDALPDDTPDATPDASKGLTEALLSVRVKMDGFGLIYADNAGMMPLWSDDDPDMHAVRETLIGWLAAREAAAATRARAEGQIVCSNCEATDLGCTACGAHDTLTNARGQS